MILCRRAISVICVLMLFGASAIAAPIDSLSARRIGLSFLQQRHTAAHNAPRRSVAGLTDADIRVAALRRAYLVSSAADFVLVASNDVDAPVLGYGSFPSAECANGRGITLPPPLRAMLSAERATDMAYPPVGIADFQPIAPLLTTIRHQKSPYNSLCPHYRLSDGSDYQCVVGCVATAMEQVLTYHRRTITLLDTLHGWSANHYTIGDELPGQSIDTRIICDDYHNVQRTDAQIDAVARLSYWLGVAAHMDWGISSSGASSSRLVEPLQKAFGMRYVHLLDSYKYDPADYWNFLAREIQARRPVYYAGYIMRTGGHAFVLDGLDADGLFHVNWGYGGNYDGYYRLDVLSYAQPASDRRTEYVTDGFFCNQEAIVLSPDEQPDAVLPDTLPRNGAEVVVDSVCIPLTPLTGRYTPLRIFVRNTSATQSYTTPFAVLENLATDTALIDQASWINLTGCTLAPLEQRELLVHSRFTRSGKLLVSLTPDGERLSFSIPVSVSEGSAQAFGFGSPQVTFPSASSATISQQFTNLSSEERAAQCFIYELADDEAGSDCQVTHYIYMDAAADTTIAVTFQDLVPGKSYTFNLRESWPIAATTTFVMPGIEGIAEAEKAPVASSSAEAWFTTSGIRLSARPDRPGIYLLRRGGSTVKIICR